MRARIHRRGLLRVLAGLGGSIGAGQLLAQDAVYPRQPVRIIVPYAAGGVVDLHTRAITVSLQQLLQQPFVVEARAGANGNIGTEAVARAEPDGYTLLVTANYLINNPLLEGKLRWRPEDFTPVARFANSPSYVVVNNDVPARNMRELVAWIKASKQPVAYADGGSGSTQSMAALAWQKVAGFQMNHIMYKGAPPSIPDLIQGLCAVSILPASVAMPQIAAGKLRVLANLAHGRSPQLPNVPTVAESGYPEMAILSWFGLHAPAGTPKSVIERLSNSMQQASAQQEVRDRYVAAGGEEAFQNTAAFTQFLAQETKRLTQLVKLLQS